MDKMQSRYHNPHLLSIGFIVSKNESPNENRFLNINKSPEMLSTMKRIKSPDLSGYSFRKEEKPIINCASIYYDSNLDSVRPNPAKPVLDFKRCTARRERPDGSGFQGIIDNSKVKLAQDTMSLQRQFKGYQ